MPGYEHPKDENRVALEEMSTTELEELLRQDFHAPEGGAKDMGELYWAAEVLAGREPDPVNADRAWESFQERYLPFFTGGSAAGLRQRCWSFCCCPSL